MACVFVELYGCREFLTLNQCITTSRHYNYVKSLSLNSQQFRTFSVRAVHVTTVDNLPLEALVLQMLDPAVLIFDTWLKFRV